MTQALSAEADKRAALTLAFEQFNQLSSQLTEAYGRLEQRVTELNRELANSRRARISERAEKERLADRLSQLLEALPAAVVLVDHHGRIDRFNPAARALFPGVAWGRRWPEVRDETLIGQGGGGEWLLADGRRVDVSRRPLADAGEILVLIDATARRHLEDQLARQERLTAMGEMAAQLAHQIRTPLSAALLYAGQLARPALSAEHRRGFADKLVARLHHTERLVVDILAFARGGRFLPEPVDPLAMVRGAIDTLQPRVRSQGASIELSAPEGAADRCPILGNRDALQGALVNILDNALVHGGESVRIAVEVEPLAVGLRIRIRDDGPGIAEDQLPHIFDPFYTTAAQGTGLGLAVVQAVVLEHGGDLVCRIEQGTVFELTLPCAAPGDATHSERTNA